MTAKDWASVVALRKESVDRNRDAGDCTAAQTAVALRKESVDRNSNYIRRLLMSVVALRKESVDRNSGGACAKRLAPSSLSARRAWIEIQNDGPSYSVHESLSARRAWIEIERPTTKTPDQYVALRKESVDRNLFSAALKGRAKPSLSARRAWIEMGKY